MDMLGKPKLREILLEYYQVILIMYTCTCIYNTNSGLLVKPRICTNCFVLIEFMYEPKYIVSFYLNAYKHM